MQPVCNKHALTSTIWPRFQKAITELDAAVDDVIPIINHIRSDCISNERIIRDTEREKELRSLRLRINVKLKVLLSDHTPREMIYSLICGKLDELESEIAPLESRHSQETADKLRSAWYFIRMNQDESKVTGARIANYLDISSDRFKKKYAPLLKQEFGIQNDNDGKGYYDPELRNLHMRYDGNDVPF